MNVSNVFDEDFEYTYDFYSDSQPPTLTFYKGDVVLHEGDMIADPYVEVSCFFEDELGLHTMDFYIGTWGNPVITMLKTDYGMWYYTCTPLADGSGFEVVATAIDLAGNVTTQTLHLIMDRRPRVISVAPLNNTWINSATPDLYAEFTVPVGTLTGGTMTINDQEVDVEVANSRVYARNFSLPDGEYTVEVVGWNEDLLESVPYSWTVKVDTVASDLDSVIHNGWIIAASTSDDASGPDCVELYIDETLIGIGTSQTPDYDAIYDIPDGTYTLRAVAYDVAGNQTRKKWGMTVDRNAGGCVCGQPSADTDLIVQILRQKDASNEWMPVSNLYNNKEVYVGEFMKLKLGFSRTIQNENLSHQWTVGGKRVRYWRADEDESFLVDMGLFLSSPTLQFYWHAGSPANGVTGTVTTGNNVLKSASTVFKVKAPEIAFTAEWGSSGDIPLVYQSDVFWTLSLGRDTSWETAGIRFEATIQEPNMQPARLNLAQIVTSADYREYSKHDTVNRLYTNLALKYLDTKYPYKASIFPQQFCKDSDSPPVLLDNTERLATTDEKFRMYAMFRPYGIDSIFVPIKFCDWAWVGSAYNVLNEDSEYSDTWTLGSSQAWKQPVFETDDFPEWNALAKRDLVPEIGQ